MPRYTPDEIRTIFSTSHDFNELFDAFEDAVGQGIKDVDAYRLLFWNNALSPDEVCLFGEKLVAVFSDLRYEVFMWLASVFEVTYSSYDNFELAMRYYKKAANARPDALEPYIEAADCFNPDLNIPPVETLIDFLHGGIARVGNKKPLLERIASLYEATGNEEKGRHYRRLADDIDRSVN